jgi:hypothetical protein
MIPFILAFQITNKLEIRELGNRILVGVFVGGFTGGLPALLLIVIDTIEYYLLGDRELAASVLGNSPPQLTLYTFSMSIVSTMSLWITLLIVSSLVGLVAGVISGNKRFRPK